MNPFPQKQRRGYWQRVGGKFLVLSIIAHLLFIAGAAYLILQYSAPKSLTFTASVPVSSSAQKDAKIQSSLAQQRDPAGAPAPMRQVLSKSEFTKIVLPSQPDIFSNNSIIPTQIPGSMGANPFGGLGGGLHGPPGDGGSGNGPFTLGVPTYRPGMLKGTFYDLKFLNGGRPAKDPGKDYAGDISHFVVNGWNDSYLGKYLKGSQPLYASQVFFPVIESNDGPTAFKSPRLDSPGKWVVVYKGEVSPPESGIYHFVAAGDDDMIIRFNNQTVLFHCEHIPTPPELQGTEYHYAGERLGYARGVSMKVEAGKTYSIEILIGDDIPTKTFAKVLIEKEGVEYQHDAASGPILPVFGLDAISPTLDAETPAHLKGPLWQGKSTNSIMDTIGQ